MMTERLAERIRQCAALVGSGDELARVTGIPRRTLEYYLSGEREPKASRCLQIARAAGVQIGWLVSGEGPMLNCERQECDQLDQCLQIPLHDPDASDQRTPHLSLPAAWIGVSPTHSHQLLALRIEGDGMSPTLRPGDILVVDRDSRRIQDGQLFVIQDQDNLMVKRLQPTLGGKVRILSDNQRYPEFQASSNELNIVGRVIWKGGTP